MSADDGQMTLFTSTFIVQPQRKSWACMMKTADLAHSKLSFIPLVGSHRLVFRVIVGEVLRQELPRFGGVSGIDWDQSRRRWPRQPVVGEPATGAGQQAGEGEEVRASVWFPRGTTVAIHSTN